MSTIAENLQIISDSTNAIKQAILDRGGNVEGGLINYANSVMNIPINYYNTNKPLITFIDDSITLTPNIYYRKTNQTQNLTINLGPESDTTIMNEYIIEFTTASSGIVISLPSSIKWANGETPEFEKNSTYQISIVNNLGVYVKFS